MNKRMVAVDEGDVWTACACMRDWLTRHEDDPNRSSVLAVYEAWKQLLGRPEAEPKPKQAEKGR